MIHIEVPADLASIDTVRSRLVTAAEGLGIADPGPLALVASEIVTNAIVHARTGAHLTFRRVASDEVELAVTDHGAGDPQMRRPGDDQTGGRGLQIVDALSSSWGVRHDGPDETTVWVRLPDGR